MFFHPLIAGFVLVDAVVIVLILVSIKGLFQILTEWKPEDPSKKQLSLERDAEAISLVGRTITIAFVISTALLVMVIAELLPSLVPGAMCGTGVLQATRGAASRAVLFRVAALLILAIWSSYDRTSRATPLSHNANGAAKALLSALPLIALGMFESLRMFWKLDLREPVDCCSTLFNRIGNSVDESTLISFLEQHWSIIYFGGALPIALYTGLVIVLNKHASPKVSWGFAAFALAWSCLAAAIVTVKLSAYHFGVLEHRCLWCLFLSEHAFVGYLIFPALLAISANALSLAAVSGLGTAQPRRNAAILLVSMFFFVATTLLPALTWRLSFGVWID